MEEKLYIGLMSGTSVDAIDAALVGVHDSQILLIETTNLPLSDAIKQAILQLCLPGDNEIQKMKELDRQLGQLFSEAVQSLLAKAGKSAQDIVAIGSHGQTIRHNPTGTPAFSLQIGDPNTIAEITGITTVADFRQRDIAAGGQGAPLLPLFHKHSLIQKADDVALNIGGISNITFLNKINGQLTGFDTGPGNILLDYWIHKTSGHHFDNYGEWAKSGTVDRKFLDLLMQENYFDLGIPKSTGRELFNAPWLEGKLDEHSKAISPEDVQCSLTELTAITIAQEISKYIIPGRVIVCGGGARNSFLLSRLQSHLPKRTSILASDELGIAAEWVEATAFAWFAHNTLNHKPSNVFSCTGAKGDRVLGGIYYA